MPTFAFHLTNLALETVVGFVEMPNRFFLGLDGHPAVLACKIHVVLLQLLLQIALAGLEIRKGHIGQIRGLRGRR